MMYCGILKGVNFMFKIIGMCEKKILEIRGWKV